MSVTRKFKRKPLQVNVRQTPPVLIIKPHNTEGRTCEKTSTFIAQAVVRGIADCKSYATKAPELARNSGIMDFLRNHPKKTHIYFQDDDSPPKNPYAIEHLLSLNKPVVCGVTPIKREEGDKKHFQLLWSPIVTAKGHTEAEPKLDNIGIDEMPHRPFVCYRTGGTALLVRRDVLEKLKPPYQKTTYNDMVTDVKLSEDIYFCDKIRAAGFEIWADPGTVCHHYHTEDILDYLAVFEQGKQMGAKSG